MTKKVRSGELLLAILASVHLCGLAASALERMQSSFRTSVKPNTTQEPIRVESNLVLVPVFVFYKDRIGKVRPEQWECLFADAETFFGLPQSTPYFPKSCDETLVAGLKAQDFHLFDDGVEQKIESVTAEGWWVATRDNRTWHIETSDTPSGIWSSTDLGDSEAIPAVRRFNLLAYVPRNPSSDGCHKIEVKVDGRGTRVYARDEYCAGQSASDPLFGTNLSKRLEGDLESARKSKIALTLQWGFFYTGSEKARVDIRAGFPWNRLNHDWDYSTWTLWAEIGVLGTICRKDGSLAARFSDLEYPLYWPRFLEHSHSDSALDGLRTRAFDMMWLPAHYETQVELPPGEYTLRVVVNDGAKFGRVETPLTIDEHGGKQVALSSVMLCKRFRDAHVAAVEAASSNLAPQYVPLVSKGIRLTPTVDTRFKSGEPMIAYFEIYEPSLVQPSATAGHAVSSRSALSEKPTVEAHTRIVQANGGEVIKDFPPVDAAPYKQPGSSVISIAREIPIDKLSKGAYRLEVQATDSAGRSTSWRTASFTIE